MKVITLILSLFILDSSGMTVEISPRVFGGSRIGSEDFLSKVTVGVYNKKLNLICTGTIISENIILTAAHCIEGVHAKNMEVVFDQNIYASVEKREKVSDLIVHNSYVHSSIIENDLALLKLKRSIRSGYEVMDLSHSIDLELSKHILVEVAGFGVSRVNFPRMGAGTLRKTEVKLDFYDAHEKLLVLDQSEGKGICFGDSGGGAFYEINGELIQIGVNSFVNSKEENHQKVDCKNKAFLTNISYFYSWITQSMDALLSR